MKFWLRRIYAEIFVALVTYFGAHDFFLMMSFYLKLSMSRNLCVRFRWNGWKPEKRSKLVLKIGLNSYHKHFLALLSDPESATNALTNIQVILQEILLYKFQNLDGNSHATTFSWMSIEKFILKTGISRPSLVLAFHLIIVRFSVHSLLPWAEYQVCVNKLM